MKPIANPGDSRLNGVGDGTDHRVGQRIFRRTEARSKDWNRECRRLKGFEPIDNRCHGLKLAKGKFFRLDNGGKPEEFGYFLIFINLNHHKPNAIGPNFRWNVGGLRPNHRLERKDALRRDKIGLDLF